MNFYNLKSSDWQNLIYLSLILAMLVASFVTRRNVGFSKALKYISAWSAIGFIVVVLYSYRYEFSDFKTRILGEINPSSAIVKKSGELVINLSQDGHFYIDIFINNIPARFMIDTGASDIVISIEEAKRFGINTNKLVFNKEYQTANGKSFGAFVILNELKVSNIKYLNVSASVNGGNMGTSLLGMSFLRQFEKYEFYRDKLVLKMK